LQESLQRRPRRFQTNIICPNADLGESALLSVSRLGWLCTAILEKMLEDLTGEIEVQLRFVQCDRRGYHSTGEQGQICQSDRYRRCAENRPSLVAESQRPSGDSANPVDRKTVAELEVAELGDKVLLDSPKGPSSNVAAVQPEVESDDKQQSSNCCAGEPPFRSFDNHQEAPELYEQPGEQASFDNQTIVLLHLKH
jgi:hypothetical protein